MTSPKTSCKGARNPCREMTHENSEWAGHYATADADERRVASSIIELPSCEAVESHTSTQVPFVPLCVHVSLVGTEKFHKLFTLVVQCRSL